MQNTEKVYLTDEMLESGEYVKVLSVPRAERCRWQSAIRVYRRARAHNNQAYVHLSKTAFKPAR